MDRNEKVEIWYHQRADEIKNDPYREQLTTLAVVRGYANEGTFGVDPSYEHLDQQFEFLERVRRQPGV